MPLINKLIELPGTENQSWESPSEMPDGHVLVEKDYPRSKEDGSRLFIPCLYHLGNFPRLINKGWGVSVIKTKFMSDGVKADFRHAFPKAIGA